MSVRVKEDDGDEFDEAVKWTVDALQAAACLDEQTEAVAPAQTVIDDTGRLVSLAYKDWFELRGLQLCARFGPCWDEWPPWFDVRAKRQWEAWRAQGALSAVEARREFVQAVAALPGRQLSIALQLLKKRVHPCVRGMLACSDVVRDLMMPCLTAEDALSTERNARHHGDERLDERLHERLHERLDERLARQEAPGTLRSFVGRWSCVRTTGLDEYLKHMGVSLVARIGAKAFRPNPVVALVDGHLVITMSTPLGERVERLNLQQTETEVDPEGRPFSKSVDWRGATLVSVARSLGEPPLSDDITTERWLDERGRLVQLTSFDGRTFRREFERVHEDR